MVYGAIIGVVGTQVLGFLWYAPWLFGNLWMKTTHPGKTEEEIGKQTRNSMAISVGSSVCLCFLLNLALGPLLKAGTIFDACVRGLLISMVITLIDVPHYTFSCRSLVGFLIDHAYDCAVITLMCVSIASF